MVVVLYYTLCFAESKESSKIQHDVEMYEIQRMLVVDIRLTPIGDKGHQMRTKGSIVRRMRE